MTLLEKIMLARLILELIALAPSLIGEIEAELAKMRSTPTTAGKASAVADGVSQIAASVGNVLATTAAETEK